MSLTSNDNANTTFCRRFQTFLADYGSALIFSCQQQKLLCTNCLTQLLDISSCWTKGLKKLMSYSFLALITSLVLCVKAKLKSFFSIYVLSKKQKHLQKNFHLVCYSGNNNLKLCVFSLYILVIIITVFVHEVLV